MFFSPKRDRYYQTMPFCYFEEFGGNSERTSLLSQKSDSQKRALKYTESWGFFTIFERGKPWEKFGFVKTTVFDQTRKRGQILKNIVFVSKESHILLNFSILLFWSIFEKFIENFSFLSKSDYLRNEHWKTQKVCFSYHFWKGQIMRKIWICLNKCFRTNQKNGININKTVFLPKVGHILLNCAFLLFWIIFGEIHREILCLVKSYSLRNEN